MDELTITGWGDTEITCKGEVGNDTFTVSAADLPGDVMDRAVGDLVINGWPITEMTVTPSAVRPWTYVFKAA